MICLKPISNSSVAGSSVVVVVDVIAGNTIGMKRELKPVLTVELI